MSYNPQESINRNLSLQQKLERDVSICRKVVTTLETQGWKDVIAPLIDKMIIDIVGGKIKGKWVSGLLNRAKSEEKREYYIGYKQALIDLHNRTHAYEVQFKIKTDELSDLKVEEKSPSDSIKRSKYNQGDF